MPSVNWFTICDVWFTIVWDNKWLRIAETVEISTIYFYIIVNDNDDAEASNCND